MLLHVAFTEMVKLKTITVIGGDNGTSPCSMKVFINKESFTLEDAEHSEPLQYFELIENFDGQIECLTRFSQFQSVSSVDLGFFETFGAENLELNYVGFRGEITGNKRRPVVAVYESKPMPEDHEMPSKNNKMNQNIF